jgi:hypothetical protein
MRLRNKRGRERVAEEARRDGLRLRAELEKREQERSKRDVKKRNSTQSGKSGPCNGRVTDLRDLVLSG